MRYMGGKQRQAKGLVEALQRFKGVKAYSEPFCGALGSAEKLVPLFAKHGASIHLSDNNKSLVCLLNAVLSHKWLPPDWTSEATYAVYAAKRHCPIDDDPMTAWCGYGLSFGGKWFGGFARGGDKGQTSETMQLNQKKALLRKRDALAPFVDVVHHCSYDKTLPIGLVYCDPPYANRTVAHFNSSGFCHETFWGWAMKSSLNAELVVTEFVAPVGWEPLYSWGDTVVTHSKGASNGTGVNERLWHRAKLSVQV